MSPLVNQPINLSNVSPKDICKIKRGKKKKKKKKKKRQKKKCQVTEGGYSGVDL